MTTTKITEERLNRLMTAIFNFTLDIIKEADRHAEHVFDRNYVGNYDVVKYEKPIRTMQKYIDLISDLQDMRHELGQIWFAQLCRGELTAKETTRFYEMENEFISMYYGLWS